MNGESSIRPAGAPPEFVQFLTVNLKLRRPSKHKAALITRAMRSAARARAAVLAEWEHDAGFASARESPPPRAEARKLASRLVAGIRASHAALQPVPNGLRDGVVEDCAMMLKSRLRLLAEHDEKAGAPDLLPRPSGFAAGLAALAASITREEYDAARDLMATRARDDLRPLRFTRWRAHDGFRLLADQRQRVWIALPLGGTTRYRKDDGAAPDLFDLRTGRVAKLPGRTVLYPVDCGQWQLERIMSGEPKSAVLSYRDGVFTLHVSVAIPVLARPVRETLVVGVDRGIDALAAVVAADARGKAEAGFIAEGETLRSMQRRAEARARHAQISGRNVRPIKVSRAADIIVHETSRAIVDLAAKRGAAVALEKLANISNGPHRRRPKGARRAKALNRQLSRAQYDKLEAQVRYKLRLAGLIDCYGRAAMVSVPAGGTSQTCAECGHRDRANRPSRAKFNCVACGHKAHADANAARNIACRGFEAIERMRAVAAAKGLTLFPAPQLEGARTTATWPGCAQPVQNVRQGAQNSGNVRNALRAGRRFSATKEAEESDFPKGLAVVGSGGPQNGV